MSFPLWVVGVILVVVGSLGNNLGNNLVSLDHTQKREEEEERKKDAKNKQKKSTSEEDEVERDEENDEDPSRSVKYKPNSIEAQDSNASLIIQTADTIADVGIHEEKKKKVSYRITGTVIFILGNLFTFGAFGFGAQSLLASLESIQFVSNLFFVRFVHKEVVTIRMIIATLSIVGGNIMVVVFANHSATLFTSDGMIHLYQTNYFYWGYFGLALCIFIVTNGIYQYYYNSRMVWKKPLLWRHNFFEPFCYACSAAIVGTQAVLNAKCMAMLIQVAIRGEKSEFTYWYIWMIFGTWILMVAYWLNRIDTGLELYPPLFIIPVMQVFFVFFAILCGGIYFREFDEFTTTKWIGFSIGVFMILFGVYGLAPPDLVLIIPDEDGCNSESKGDEDLTLDNNNNSDKQVEADLETGSSLTEEQKIKREIVALEKKLKSVQNSSNPGILSIQVEADNNNNNLRIKPTPVPMISMNSSGTVLVSVQEDIDNKEMKNSLMIETPLADPVPQFNSNNNNSNSNSNSSSIKQQGIILPPINRSDTAVEALLGSSPSTKKSRKVIKRKALEETNA